MKKMLRYPALATIVLLGLVASSRESAAASYGNFIDPTGTVSYQNVRDVNGLFGAPSVNLDSLDFTPTQYQAACSQCPFGVSTSDTLSLDILAIPGKEITEIEISEGLDYTLQSLDSAGLASARVLASVFISVSELNGVAVSGIGSSVSVLFSPSNTLSVDGFGIQSGIILGGTGLIDIQQIITNAGFTGDATRISLDFGNTLQAFHDGSLGSASIRKRDADFLSLTVAGGLIVVPEPTTAILLMGGLALLARRTERTT
jgi:hypothetical protein